MPRRPHRVVFHDTALLTPSLRMLGWNSNRAARDTPLPGHAHDDAYEVCLITRGSVEWWAGEETYEVGPWEFYVTRPGEPHGGVDAVIQPCDLYWLLVTPPERGAVAEGLRRVRLRHFPATRAVEQAFRRLIEEHERRDTFSGAAAAAIVDDLLVQMLRLHDEASQRRATASTSDEIEAAMRWMTERLAEDFAVADAADAVGLSVAQFHERFRNEVGHAPGEWRTRCRLALAKALLRRRELTVTEVAMRCGFSTSQYFATAFKSRFGLTPRDYRRRATGA